MFNAPHQLCSYQLARCKLVGYPLLCLAGLTPRPGMPPATITPTSTSTSLPPPAALQSLELSLLGAAAAAATAARRQAAAAAAARRWGQAQLAAAGRRHREAAEAAAAALAAEKAAREREVRASRRGAEVALQQVWGGA
jgi:hypothetical protein